MFVIGAVTYVGVHVEWRAEGDGGIVLHGDEAKPTPHFLALGIFPSVFFD